MFLQKTRSKYLSCLKSFNKKNKYSFIKRSSPLCSSQQLGPCHYLQKRMSTLGPINYLHSNILYTNAKWHIQDQHLKLLPLHKNVALIFKNGYVCIVVCDVSLVKWYFVMFTLKFTHNLQSQCLDTELRNNCPPTYL